MNQSDIVILGQALDLYGDLAAQEVLWVLEDLRDNVEDADQNAGICFHMGNCIIEVESEDEELADAMQSYWDTTADILFRNWEHFSGMVVFPVGIPGSCAKKLFVSATDAASMWRGEYGAMRLKLLDYLIEEYKALLQPNHAARYNHNQASEV